MGHRIVVAGLLAVLVMGGAAFADDTSAPQTALREQIGQLKLGTTVEVTLQDGQKTSGMLLDASDRGVTLQTAPAAEPQLIEYARVKSIQAGRGGEPFGLADPIKPGMLFGLIVAAAAASVWAWRRKVGGLRHTRTPA